MTLGQLFAIGPFHFYVVRTVILVGCFRAIWRGELRALDFGGLDAAVLAWLVILLTASLGHGDPGSQFITVLGVGFNSALVYFLFRALNCDVADVVVISRWLAGILLVVAGSTPFEKASGRNPFEAFGGVATSTREGTVRATGPFRHAILAGSTGAALMPRTLALWLRTRGLSGIGAVASAAMAWASASSGPILTLVSGAGALWAWRYRRYRSLFVWGAVAGLCMLELAMSAHVWYLLARVDLTGGSTGWHRAFLIQQALEHIGEWWLCGSDYTRHWMPTGVYWSENHADITNHFIWLGITGGLGLVAVHVCVLTLAFRGVGRVIARASQDAPPDAVRVETFRPRNALFAYTLNSLGVAAL